MKNGINIKSIFTKMCLILLLGMVTFLFVSSIFKFNDFAYNFLNIVNNTTFLVAFFTIVLAVIVYGVFKIINGCSEKHLKYLNCGFVLFMLIIQIILILTVDIIQMTDPFMVNDQALAIAKGSEQFVDGGSDYFAIFGNNYFVAVATAYFYKFLMFLGISNFNIFFELLNVFLIDIAVFLLYRTAKITFGDRKTTKILFLAVLDPMNYVMIFWFYTATYCMPLTMGVVYLAVSIWKNYQETEKINYLKMAGIGIITVVGYFLRPTVLIPLIAAIICFILVLKLNKKALLKALALGLVFLVVGALSYTLVYRQVYKYVKDDSENFPITHCVMMGLHGEGRVNMIDIEYTGSFKGKEAKTEANIKEIKNTLNELGVGGFLKHLTNKIQVTWTDGTGDYSQRMQQVVNTGNVYDWVFGQRSGFLIVYCQIFRVLTLGLAALGILKQILRKKYDINFFFSLTLLGGIVFYLIWEAKEIYSLTFIPFLLVLACSGMDTICNRTERIKVDYRKKIVIALTFVLQIVTLITGIVYQTGFTKNEFWWRDTVIQSNNNAYMDFVSLTDDKSVIQQNFYAKKEFNQIEIACTLNEGQYNEYTIELLSGGKKLAQTKVNPNMVEGNKVMFFTGSQTPKGEQQYSLRIKAKDEQPAIDWGMHVYKELNVYKGGSYINGEKQNMDLYMNVLYSYRGAHMSIAQYWIMIVVLLIIEAVAGYVIIRKMKEQKSVDIK